MSDDAAIRRANLRRISTDANVLRDRAGRGGYSYWAALLNGSKSFGEKAARSIEADLQLPRGWLDQAHADAAPPVAREEPARFTAVPPKPAAPALEQALPVVLEALARLPAARAVSVRAQLDLVMGHPEMRDEALAELQHLLALPDAPPGKRSGTAG